MDEQQYKRYRKMNSDSIECLYRTCDKNNNCHFLISGSSGTRYKVSINDNGVLSCSCPDAKHAGKVEKCLCKHCLYIIFKELEIFDSVDNVFF
jgi:hypothetical protein